MNVDADLGLPRIVDRGRAYYPALDGLRAVAFLLVFGFHYLDIPWGWGGVDIFFVLSGFLITGILYDTQDDRHRVRNFYLRRTLRIFPLYYATLGLVYAFAVLVNAHPGAGFLAWVFYVGNWTAFLHPAHPTAAFAAVADGLIQSPSYSWLALLLSHFWSLCVEEQFYLLWPAVVFLVRDRRRLIAICLLLILCCPLARVLVQNHVATGLGGVKLAYRGTFLRLDAFMFGGLLALLRRGTYPRRLDLAARMFLAVVGLPILVLLGPRIAAVPRHLVYVYPNWEYTWGLTLIDLLSVCLIVEALRPASPIYRLLNLGPLRWLGRISYGAYVFHFVPISVYSEFVNRLPVQHKMFPVAGLAFCATLLLAWISFRYFESPFIAMKNSVAGGKP